MASNRQRNQAIWLDGGVTTSLGATLFMPGQLGSIFTKDGKTYQLVKFLDSVVVNNLVYWSDEDDFVVTTVLNRNKPAGGALGTVAAASHGFIQTGGPGNVLEDTSVTANKDEVVAAANTMAFAGTTLKMAVGREITGAFTATTGRSGFPMIGYFTGAAVAGVAPIVWQLAGQQYGV